MRIALYGPTGAGKSTLAQAFQRLYKMRPISTGEFIRKNFPNDPLTGGFSDREKQIAEYVEQAVRTDGAVLDGFPRHVRQVKWLQKLERIEGFTFAHLFISITRPEAEKRIRLRGRGDLDKFAEQYEAQAEAARLIHEHMEFNNVKHFHVYGPWDADSLAHHIVRFAGVLPGMTSTSVDMSEGHDAE